MPYDIDYREVDAVLIDTAYNLINTGPDVRGAFFVPGDAKAITRVRISAAPDATADDPAGYNTAVHLTGMGLKNKDKNYAFPGPFGYVISDTAAFSAALIMGDNTVYKTNIPVVGGNEIVALGYYWGVAGAGMRIGIWLEFDGIPGPIVDVDYRESDLAAVNTPVELINRGGAFVGPFKTTGKRIIQVRCGGGFTHSTGVAALSCLSNYRFWGPALLGADYEHSGPSYSSQEDHAAAVATAGGGGEMTIADIQWANIPCDNGAVFHVEGQMIEDDVGTIYGTCTVCYG